MSFVARLACVNCGADYAEGQAMTCPACGVDEGILDVAYDLGAAGRTLTRAALTGRPRSLWRYRELLPVDGPLPPTLAHVGWTPLIDAPRLANTLGVARLRLKDDSRNPSGSFKDRASSVGVAHARQTGFVEIACASTGNAASSLACCAAAASMHANIFVSQRIPAAKLVQLLACEARVFKIRGSYADAFDLCTRACERFGWYNRNCAINPYLVEGKKTGGLEVAEQCADDPPDWVVCSVGDGCSIAGLHKGLVQARAIGLIDWNGRLLGVQAAGVCPIARAFETGSLSGRHGRDAASGRPGRVGRDAAAGPRVPLAACPPVSASTYADSINVPVPRNWRKAVSAVQESRGAFVTVTDEQIMEAVRLTGRLTGIFAEPAAAAAVAGVAEAQRRGLLDARASVVAVITGNGLKDIDGARQAIGEPHEITADFDQVLRIVESENSSNARHSAR